MSDQSNNEVMREGQGIWGKVKGYWNESKPVAEESERVSPNPQDMSRRKFLELFGKTTLGIAGEVALARIVGSREALAQEQANHAYALGKSPLAELTRESLETLRDESSVVVIEGGGVEANVYNLAVSLKYEDGKYKLPFEYDGERFKAHADELLNWANGFVRADGQAAESGDFSVVFAIGDDQATMALKLNHDYEFDGPPLKEGTLFTVDIDRLDQNGVPTIHYLEPLVTNGIVNLLTVDQDILDRLKEKDLPEEMLPEIGSVAMVHGTRVNQDPGNFKIISIALESTAFVWIDELTPGRVTEEVKRNFQTTATPAPVVRETMYMNVVESSTDTGSARILTQEELTGLNTEGIEYTTGAEIIINEKRMVFLSDIPEAELTAAYIENIVKFVKLGEFPFNDGDQIRVLYFDSHASEVPSQNVFTSFNNDKVVVIKPDGDALVRTVYLSQSLIDERLSQGRFYEYTTPSGKDIVYDYLAIEFDGAFAFGLASPATDSPGEMVNLINGVFNKFWEENPDNPFLFGVKYRGEGVDNR